MLSVGLAAWSKENGIIETHEVLLRSDAYSCTQEAKRINKININLHNEKAVSHKHAVEVIRSFCFKNTQKTKEIQIAGHNTQFDAAFLKKLFEEQHHSFNRMFSHRMIDTYSILKYLVDIGKIDLNPISSSNAFRYFNIKVNGRHSALGDAIATAKLYEKLLSIYK